MKHDAERDSQRASASVAAAAARFDAVATALARGGPAEVEAFLSLWFHDRPVDDIGRGNLKELLAYAFFYAESSAAVAAQGHGAVLESMVDRLELLLHHPGAAPPPAPDCSSAASLGPSPRGAADPSPDLPGPQPQSPQQPEPSALFSHSSRFEELISPATASSSGPASSASPPRRVLPLGTTPGLRFMAHMTEPLPHFYRPWVFYAAMEAMAWINHCMLMGAGFQRMTWQHPPPPPRQRRQQSQAAAVAPGGDGEAEEDAEDGHPDDHYYYVANMPAAATGGGGDGGSAAVPIVFLHGVGMGLMPYLRLLVALAATGAPVIAFELKHISQRWTSGQPPSMQRLAGDVVSALRRHGYSQAAVLAHSFGTAVASVLLQAHPGVVRHVTMLDPICFQMYAPRLLRNFIYRRLGATCAAAAAAAAATAAAAAAAAASGPAKAIVTASAAAAALESAAALSELAAADAAAPPAPTGAVASPGSGGGLFGAVSWLVRAGAGLVLDLLMLGPARELHCTSLLCRRVVWSEINLWEHLVPEHCTVVLSGRDDLMCARSLERWLRDHTPANVVVHSELHHAQICVAWTRQDQVLDHMLRTVYGSNNGGAEPAAAAASIAVPPVAAEAGDDPDAADTLYDKVVVSHGNNHRCGRSSAGGFRVEPLGEWLGTDPRVSVEEQQASLEAVADDQGGADADSDCDLFGLGRTCRGGGGGGGRRRCISLDSPREVWDGAGGSWRQRLGSGAVGCGGASTRRLSPWESGEAEDAPEAAAAAEPSTVRRLMVVRHDSAGSYMRLPSGGALAVDD
ncbi:hypothetical protein PLESTM_001101400 [Pleodorina starrii]|nr:hypothetical protein PLESTM_001101400 [Pleodorina starrii]